MPHSASVKSSFTLLASVVLLLAVSVLTFPYYQPAAVTALTAFVLFAGIGAVRPYSGLILWLAVVPWLSLAKWTGVMVVEEFDLALWGYAAGLAYYAWRHWDSAARNISWQPLLLLVLLLAFAWQLWALLKGFQLLPPASSAFFTNYEDQSGPIRIGKALFSALCFYGCCRLLSVDWPRFQSALNDGFALGAASAVLGCLYERFYFTGLLNLSTDYRTTGWFWEMHTGGATLDAYLALSLPFLLQGVLFSRQSGKKLAYALLLAAYGYVALTTFSRGVYIALPLIAALFIAVHLLARRRRGQTFTLRDKPRLLLMLAIMLLSVIVTVALFDMGGYRLLLVVSGVELLLLFALTQRAFNGTATLAGLGVACCGAALFFLTFGIGKAVYLGYAVCWGATLLLLLLRTQQLNGWLTDAGISLLLTTLALLAAAVAWYWSDYSLGLAHLAALSLLPALVVSLLLPLASADAQTTVYGLRQSHLAAGIIWAVGSALSLLLAMLLHSSYIDSRFATTDKDLSGRFEHWQKALQAMEQETDVWLGSGVGRFVSLNRQRGETDDQVAILTLLPLTTGNALYLRSGLHVPGYGEVFRLTQQIDKPKGDITLELELRHTKRLKLLAEVCDKQLLYHGRCARGSLTLKDATEGVARYSLQLKDNPFAEGGAPLSKTFSLSVNNRDTEVVLESLVLRDSQSDNLLRNSRFTAGMQGWFFSSDRHHMPYHVKGLWPMQWFEMGLLGLVLWTVLTVLVIARQLLPGRHFSLAGSACALALTGILLVGLFDSVIDGGRMAMLYFAFVLLCGGIKPAAAVQQHRV
jgi:hypothetical protein